MLKLMIPKIKRQDILVVLTAGLLILDIPSLYYVANPRIYKLVLFPVVLLVDIIYILRHKIALRMEHVSLLLSALVVVVSTGVYGGTMFSCLSDLSTIIAVCFLFIIYSEKKQLVRMLKQWCWIFFILLIIDTASMLLYPNGLYSGTFVRYNWFLGYKTVRLTYTFSLLTFYTYVELMEKETLSWLSLAIAILVTINAYMSNSIGSTMVVGAYSLVILLAFRHMKTSWGHRLQKLTRQMIFSYNWIFVVWLVAFLLIVVFYNTTIVQNLIGRMDKGYSFGQRILGWTNAISSIRKHWVVGMGVQTRAGNMEITGGLANAHNTVFTYLLTGGAVGMLLLMFTVYSAVRRTTACSANFATTMYIYCVMFLGIFSSALAFCPFFFAALLLPIRKQTERV